MAATADDRAHRGDMYLIDADVTEAVIEVEHTSTVFKPSFS